jgi:hypothetical protein
MQSTAKVFLAFLLTLTAGTSAPSARADDSLLISEFMAANDRSVADDLGEYSDWIEIYNPGTNAVNLAGYYLTDEQANLTKWRFPATNLPPQRCLIVYASGADRIKPGQPFHTNFKLNADGEYLGLIKPDGQTIVTEFAPAFPPQEEGRSYGLAVEEVRSETLIAPNASVRFLVPNKSIGTAWTQPEFDDSSWMQGKTALKFDKTTGPLSFDNLDGTDIEAQLSGVNATVYVRLAFAGRDLSTINDLQVLMRYDDGFVAYLNGQEIARRLAPAALEWNSFATNARSNALALVSERINLIDRLSLVRPGPNVLAIQALNRSQFDTDFLLLPELVARQTKTLTNVFRFFDALTPGAANVAGLPGSAGEVRFSRNTTTFVDPFALTLEPAEPVPGAVIRYTVDRSLPRDTSPIYSSPLNLSTSLQVRAQVYAPGLFPGPVRTESFLALSANVVNFTSDLPILIIHSFGGGRLNGTSYLPAVMTIHEPVRGRSALTNAPDSYTRAAFKDRGSSTANQPKPNYAVEIWDEANRPKDFSILGMPADPDWVFHAPYNWDPALIRNPLAFALGHRTGRYAPRYRFVEVYVSSGTVNGPISSTSYAGVYNILEKVKRGKDRVDIDELLPGDVALPEVTGGYIFKIDRLDPSDVGLHAGGREIAYVEPKEAELKMAERFEQRRYLTNYFNAFQAALNSANFAHPTLGYAPYVDAAAWVDFHVVDTLTWNVDALRLSSFFHKPRHRPLVYGPLWDYDRSLGSTDSRDDNAREWGSNFFTEVWWSRLFRDPNFWQRWIDRWQELRDGPFSHAEILGQIDALAAEVAESAPRDFAKWRQPKRGNSQASEINFLKNWLTNRIDFFDTNLLQRPIFSRASGQLFAGFNLTLTAPDGAATYYTQDGTDPRLPGGNVSPAALLYRGPVTLSQTATVKARSRNLTHKNLSGGSNPPISSPWSGLSEARFSEFAEPGPGELAVTEIHFNPAARMPAELAGGARLTADDFEFLELKNASGRTLDLQGVTFSSGLEFTFGDGSVQALAAGQRLVLAKNKDAFSRRNPQVPRSAIVGPYSGTLDNNGERLAIKNAAGETILDFIYADGGYPAADGLGFSLVLADEIAAAQPREFRSAWRVSAKPGGSPNEADPAPSPVAPIVINEVLTYGDRKDAIELFNPTGAAANVSGWFLSDDSAVPKKFRIPDGTTIPAGGFRVFDEDDFKGNPGGAGSFSFNRFGEEVYLFAADNAGNLHGYAHGFAFDGSEADVTFGRWVNSAGQEQFVPQRAPSLRSANAGPKVGPVVINEIMYHPPDVFANDRYWDNHEDEYVELHNPTAQPAPLFDPLHSTNTWALRGGVDFQFPPNQVLAAQGYLLVVNFNPATKPAQLSAFQAKYKVSPGTGILGPYRGRLDNRAGSVKLFKPGEPEPVAGTNSARIPRILVDAIDYSDGAPWPVAADGIGHSLQRNSATLYGNDPANWSVALPTPGTANARPSPPGIRRQPASQIVVGGSDVTLNVLAEGAGPFAYQWRFKGQNLRAATNAALSLSAVNSANAGEYQAVVVNGTGAMASAPARLTVLEPAKIVLQPRSRNVSPGANVPLAVSVKATGSVTYQWRFNGANIPGATGANLVLTNAQLPQSGAYDVVVADRIGSVTSAPAIVNVLVRPEIVSQPQGQIALVGDTVVLNVAATGTPPLHYRWRRDSATLPFRTNATLVLANVQLSDAGAYSVLITNVASVRTPAISQDAPLLVFADFDKDGMADVWEAAHGLATNNAADALLDSDGDGLTNAQEYLAGTNPKDKSDSFKLEWVKNSSPSAQLQFHARSNRTYTVQFKDSLNAEAWLNLTNIAFRATNRMETILDPAPRAHGRFYRLVAPAVP